MLDLLSILDNLRQSFGLLDFFFKSAKSCCKHRCNLYQINFLLLENSILRTLFFIFLSTAISFGLYASKTLDVNGTSYPLTDNTIVLDKDGILDYPESFQDPNEAFNKINEIGSFVTLLVAPSVYWLDDPDDANVRKDKSGIPFAVSIACDSLSIVGLSDEPEDVVFAVNRGQTQGAIGNFTMFQFSGLKLEVKNITFGNYCNVDLYYKRKPELNRRKRNDAIVQAQIGICQNTDRLFAENCRFISRLNLCPFVGARRSLYDNCYFECTDDALSGSAVYLDCRFNFISSKPFYSTAETGAIFFNCDITCHGSGVQYFTKIPGQVTVIDTRFYSENPLEIKWTRDESDIICHQENNLLNGKPYIIDGDRPKLGMILEENIHLRRAFVVDNKGKKIYNLPNILNGNDGWDPKGLNSEISNIEKETSVKLTGLPIALRITTDAQESLNNGDEVAINAVPLLWGGEPSGKENISIYKAQNKDYHEKKVVVPISYSDALSGKFSMTIKPNLKKAPKFKQKPVIKFDEVSNSFLVDYSLSGKGEDKSSIIWGRIVDGIEGIKFIGLTQNTSPKGRTFTAKAGDFSNGLVAVVFPKFKDSQYGAWEVSEIYPIKDLEQIESYPESTLSTNFKDIYIERRKPDYPGVWCFDVYKPEDTLQADWQAADGAGWYYGNGFDASTGEGLVQNEKGARLSYVPARDICKNMTASLIAEPAKSGGQGFGSATSQYMDICVKFDPINLNGYALRIERISDHDRAVSFTLIKYENGKTAPISDKVISNCYRTPCHISVGIKDGILQASAYTDAENASKCCDKVLERVHLSALVEGSLLTGFCLQHTGSTGPSSTLIRDLNLKWE